MDEQSSAVGEPSSLLDDARLQFFLENQDRIREWASLASEVQQAVEATLRELRLDLVNDRRVQELAIVVGERANGESATGPVLYRDRWCIDSDALPDAAIALGWDGRIDPAGLWPRSTLPYVGIVTAHSTAPGRTVEQRLRVTTPGVLAAADDPAYTGFRKGSHWVVYRPIRSGRDWWRDVSTWRMGLVDHLIDTWQLWAAHVDDALSVEP